MSNKLSPAVDRAVRMELLRAKAAVEREALVHNLAEAGVALSPTHMVRSVLPPSLRGLVGGSRSGGHGGGGLSGLISGAGGKQLAFQAFTLLRRYPMVLSSASALLLGGNKKSKFLKLAAGALVGWQAFRVWKEKEGSPATARSAAPPEGRY
ncbi:hypothetical protein [Bordetella sp. N]|uniref:hypothetical protein n=1 Tax=Bordetella sp. N TaxID=1746199 RepID=UPI00070DAD18|nr:hypothetical protein [Bordetella sp. N]ALM84737.1 hypothetical protein ASB57_18705 [Bordetella sp. N]